VHATKSHHHQGVDRIGEGLEVTGWATVDELPEVIEDQSRRFALGVQWHPEYWAESDAPSAAIFEAFGAACRINLTPACSKAGGR